MHPVPKMLKPLVKEWATDGLIVSFKVILVKTKNQLETDPNLLLSKAHAALERYGHQLVIGNILATRKDSVVFVAHEQVEWIKSFPGVEIEKVIVEKLVQMHQAWRARKRNEKSI